MQAASFREVCSRSAPLQVQSGKSLNDLSDDILTRIFTLVVGPLRRQEHYINNGIPVRHEYMEPTMVSNFDDIIMLNLVCKRWHHIVQHSVELWRHVHISAVLLRIPRKSSAWLKMFFWLSRHAWKIESLHLADESAFMDNSLDTMKMGALSLLTRNLRILHLDNCFHRGANSDMVGLLFLMRRLQQLQISSVNHDFMAHISVLSSLSSLRRLQIQGNGEYWDGHCPVLVLKSTALPIQLEVISLANVRVRGFCEEADRTGTPLFNVRIMELVYVEWVGLFVSTMALLSSLEKLFVIDCDKIVIDGAAQRQECCWSQLSACTRLETFVLKNHRYGDFCNHMSDDFSGLSSLRNLKELELCPETASPERHYTFDKNFSDLCRLTRLNLTSVGLTEVPSAVTGLSRLQDLSLAGNKLSRLPTENVSYSWCLQRLILDSNAFIEIPDLSEYYNLTILQISNNPLKFYKDCDYLAALPCLRTLRLGNRHLMDILPICSASQVDEICKDLRLCPVGGFHLGSLCSSLRHKNPNFS